MKLTIPMTANLKKRLIRNELCKADFRTVPYLQYNHSGNAGFSLGSEESPGHSVHVTGLHVFKIQVSIDWSEACSDRCINHKWAMEHSETLKYEILITNNEGFRSSKMSLSEIPFLMTRFNCWGKSTPKPMFVLRTFKPSHCSVAGRCLTCNESDRVIFGTLIFFE